MLESGGQPPKRRSNYRSSALGRSLGSGHPSASDPESRKSLWQRLFQRQSQRRTRHPKDVSGSRLQIARSDRVMGSGRENLSQTRSVKSTSQESTARSVVPFSETLRGRSRERPGQLQGYRKTPSPTKLGVVPDRSLVPSRSAALSRSNNAPPAKNRRRSRSSKPRSRGASVVLYLTRMLILSVGVGVLAGTSLSVFDPSGRSLIGNQQQAVKQAGITPGNNPGESATNATDSQTNRPGQEILPLKTAIQTFSQKNPQMLPGVFLVDLDSNNYVDLGGSASISAASTIKLPILIAFFQDVDAGKIRLDEPLTVRKELVATGSGDMQFQPVGTRYSALDTATKMIIISDNTATNMLLARLGGLRALNQRFRSWGLTTTTLNGILPDLQGTNITSPRELALLLSRINAGELLSMRSRDRLFDIMRRTENDSQLPQGLGAGATIAHKTGDIASVIGDVGLVDAPNGKQYAIAVLVKRPHNDDRAYEVVSQISRLAYLYFTRPATAPSASPANPNPQIAPSPPSQETP